MERYCANCNKKLPSNKWRYCSHECETAFKAKQYRKRNPFKGKSSGTTGAISELRVSVDLLRKGYDVYRALSPNAPGDLAILIDGNLLLVEVRTTYLYADNNRISKPKKEGENPDIYAYVASDKIVFEPISLRAKQLLDSEGNHQNFPLNHV